MRQVIIGSRGSRLALWQSEYVQKEIETHHPEITARIEVIKTTGDKLSEAALAKIGSTKGLFVKEIEEYLLVKKVDLAVHSLKDVPTELPDGLCLGAIPERDDPVDVLVSDNKISSLAELPYGARLGTSSLRRVVQLQSLRPDLEIQAVRGNVDTRVRKMRELGLDGIVLAAAGLRRLGLQDKIAYVFSLQEMVPAIGQGALSVEIRADDEALHQALAPLEHPPTRCCTGAERTFLRKMGGGCQVPMGAYAAIGNGVATFTAFVADPRQSKIIRKISRGKEDELQDLALEAADYLLAQGADRILRELS